MKLEGERQQAEDLETKYSAFFTPGLGLAFFFNFFFLSSQGFFWVFFFFGVAK